FSGEKDDVATGLLLRQISRNRMADRTGPRGRWLVGAARNCEGCDDGRSNESLECHRCLLTSSFPNGPLALLVAARGGRRMFCPSCAHRDYRMCEIRLPGA